MQTNSTTTRPFTGSRGFPALSQRVVLVRFAVLAVVTILADACGGVSHGQQAVQPEQEGAEPSGGLTYQRKVQLPQGSALPAIVMTEFFTNGELKPHRFETSPSMTTGTWLSPGGSSSLGLATFAGLLSRPRPGSTFTRSTTAARARRKSRPPGPTGPACCWRPGTGRTAIFRTWNRFARHSTRPSRSAVRMFRPSSIATIRSGPTPNRFSASTAERSGSTTQGPTSSSPPARTAVSC